MATFKIASNHNDLEKLLRLEGGDVIMALGPEYDDHLLLHSSVLKAASAFFEIGMKPAWMDPAKLGTVTNPETDQEISVFQYNLRETDRVYSLQMKVACPVILNVEQHGLTNKIEGVNPQSKTRGGVIPVYLSEFGTGLAGRELHDRETYERAAGQYHHISDAVHEHQALFLFLHKVSVELWLPLSYQSIANIVAYAQMYDLLPFVAEPIPNHLLSRSDIWSDIRKYPAFHLGIAKKIRSKVLFLDALRHFVGSGVDWNILVDKLGYTKQDAALLIFPKREELAGRISDLTKKLQRIGLTPYIASTINNYPNPEVGTTFLASSFERKSSIEKANYLARSIFNEWLNQQLAGKEHWAEVRASSMEYQLSGFTPMGLRLLCSAIAEACRNETELNLFDVNAASKFAGMFFEQGTRREIQAQISDALRLLVRNAYIYAQPLITPPAATEIPSKSYYLRPLSRSVPGLEGQPSARGRASRGRGGYGRGGSRGGLGGDWGHRDNIRFNSHGITQGGLLGTTTVWIDGVVCAHDDNGISYFTCMKLAEEDVPWYGEETWKEYSIDGLKDASDEWLELVSSKYVEYAVSEEVPAEGGDRW